MLRTGTSQEKPYLPVVNLLEPGNRLMFAFNDVKHLLDRVDREEEIKAKVPRMMQGALAHIPPFTLEVLDLLCKARDLLLKNRDSSKDNEEIKTLPRKLAQEYLSTASFIPSSNSYMRALSLKAAVKLHPDVRSKDVSDAIPEEKIVPLYTRAIDATEDITFSVSEPLDVYLSSVVRANFTKLTIGLDSGATFYEMATKQPTLTQDLEFARYLGAIRFPKKEWFDQMKLAEMDANRIKEQKGIYDLSLALSQVTQAIEELIKTANKNKTKNILETYSVIKKHTDLANEAICYLSNAYRNHREHGGAVFNCVSETIDAAKENIRNMAKNTNHLATVLFSSRTPKREIDSTLSSINDNLTQIVRLFQSFVRDAMYINEPLDLYPPHLPRKKVTLGITRFNFKSEN